MKMSSKGRLRLLTLTIFICLALLVPAATAKTDLSDPVVTIPMKYSSGHVIVQVTINGRGPFPFLLDTGASGDGRIDTSLVRELGLTKVGERLNDDGSGINVQSNDLVRADSLRFGGAVFREIEFIAGDYYHRSYPTPRPVAGVLGLGLFEDLLLTVNYPKKQIELSFGQLSSEGETHVAPYRRGKDGLSCLVEVELGSRTFLAGIDTGHEGSFILPLDHLEGLRIYGRPIRVGWAKTVNNEFELYGAVLVDPLEFAGHFATNVSATFARGWGHPTIGYHILKRFALTFDQKNHLIRFAR